MAAPSPSAEPVVQHSLLKQLTFWLIAIPLLILAALTIGAATGLSGRFVTLVGLYPVAAALSLSVLSVAVLHLWTLRPGWERFPLAFALAAGWWLGYRAADAWAFRQEQAREVDAASGLLVEDFVVSGAQNPMDLVDLGLQADTGAPGLRGALLAQWRGGYVIQRAPGGFCRVLPTSTPVSALLAGLEIAFVMLMVARSLAHLRQEPVCARCGAFLRRQGVGHADSAEIAALLEEWQQASARPPRVVTQGVALVYRETCPHGHSVEPGWSIVRLRRMKWTPSVPGPIARRAPTTAVTPLHTTETNT